MLRYLKPEMRAFTRMTSSLSFIIGLIVGGECKRKKGQMNGENRIWFVGLQTMTSQYESLAPGLH